MHCQRKLHQIGGVTLQILHKAKVALRYKVKWAREVYFILRCRKHKRVIIGYTFLIVK